MQDINKKYEQMYIVPMQDDFDRLSVDIADIEKDIKKFDTALTNEEGEGPFVPSKRQPLPDSDAGKAQLLLETKVQKMHLLYGPNVISWIIILLKLLQ